MNSTTQTLSIDPHSVAAKASPITGTVSAWAAKAGWSVWYGLQSYGARRALREMRLMGVGVSIDFAPPADGNYTSGQAGTHR